MTWDFEIHGGDEIPGHPVQGTRKYTVAATVEDGKNPRRVIARVVGLVVRVNDNGVFVDKEELAHQVKDDSLRGRFITELKIAIAKEGQA